MIRTFYIALALFIVTAAGAGIASENEETGPMERAGAALDRGIDRTKDFLSDTAITARVKKRFIEDEFVKMWKIKVSTSDRVVTLEGDVASEKIAQRAVDIAAATKGVIKVNNSLEIVTRTHSTAR